MLTQVVKCDKAKSKTISEFQRVHSSVIRIAYNLQQTVTGYPHTSAGYCCKADTFFDSYRIWIRH